MELRKMLRQRVLRSERQGAMQSRAKGIIVIGKITRLLIVWEKLP